MYYIPREDVNEEYLTNSETNNTYCPIKGEASYFSFKDGDTNIKDIAWSYTKTIEKSPMIKDRIAFYSNKVKFVIEPL